MPKELTLEELVDLAERAGVPNVSGHVTAIEGAVTCFADHVANHLKADTVSDFTIASSNLRSLVEIIPRSSSQRCPKLLKDFEGDWDY